MACFLSGISGNPGKGRSSNIYIQMYKQGKMDVGSQIESYLSRVLSEVKHYILGRHNNDGPAPYESLNFVEACVSLVDEAVSVLRCLLLTVENVFQNVPA